MGHWMCPGCYTVVPDYVEWGAGESPCDCPPDAGFRVRRRSYKPHVAGTVTAVQVADNGHGGRNYLAFVAWDDGTGSRVNLRGLTVVD